VPTSYRLEALLFKIETTYNTDPVPAAATDAVRLSDHLWNTLTPGYTWLNQRDGAMNNSLVPPPPALPRGRKVSFDFGVEINGSRSGGAYAAGNKSHLSPLLASSSMAEALDTTGGTENLQYTHADTAHSSGTAYAYAGGYVFKVTGCRFVWSWPIGVGVLGTLRFRGSGIMATAPAAAAVPAPTWPVPAPVAGVNLAFTVGAWTPDGVLTAEIDQAARLEELDSGNAPDGIQMFDVGDTVQPILRLSSKVVAQATYDPYADLNARTVRAISLYYNSGVQYDRMKFTANAYVNDHKHITQGGWTAHQLELLLDSTYKIRFD
jgi:tail tube protein